MKKQLIAVGRAKKLRYEEPKMVELENENLDQLSDHPKIKDLIPAQHPKFGKDSILHGLFFSKTTALKARHFIWHETRQTIDAAFLAVPNPYPEYRNEFFYFVYRTKIG